MRNSDVGFRILAVSYVGQIRNPKSAFPNAMRLDLFLKISRLLPRRSVAQEFCDSGLISVNGSVAKSAKEVKPGDEIEIRRRSRVIFIKVVSVPEKKQIAKADAPLLYEILNEIVIDEEF